PEERAMAMRLARIGPHGEPSPALDAHIIGAAHAATGSSRSATRWPALIGLAATLALAVGITWQLKPVGEPTVDGTVQETASAPAAEVMTAPADMARQHAAPDPPPPAAPASHEATREQEALKASVTPAPARSAGTTLADPVPTRSAPTPPARPPPAPAVPSVATPAVIASDNGQPIMRGTEDRAALRAEREALSRSAQNNDARSRAMRPQIDRPTATAASPEAFPADSAQASDMAKTTQAAEMPVAQDRGLEPEDWIERIRLRRDSGDIAGARESLQLLRREHPQTLVPSDLLELTQEQP
ncbi:MAG: hypothetical protein M3414_02045, partial [Pseudomonadota bacterium]|nr:hypothetical protein [Pseudomonadota bacterium]